MTHVLPRHTVISDGRSPDIPLVTFLVPVYNEKRTLGTVLEALSHFPESREIIVIDDGSTDGTRDLLIKNPAPNQVVLFHEKNVGKGAALRTALPHARGLYIAVQDADLEYDPKQYVEMLKIARTTRRAAVFGSRFLRPNPTSHWRFLWGNKFMTRWINFLCGTRLTDAYTCYKLMERSAVTALGLVSTGFEIEAEICVRLARKNIPIMENPIVYRPRTVKEGKKIKLKDAARGAWTAFRLRFSNEP
ncbi:MAG: glycosyltransferase family 2 protein [Elusimicrobia bacterium]|nr:glycosyltransferase family 2 protein [Elusimicrobiota bacterium]